MKEKDDLMSDLKRIADIAQLWNVGCLESFDALCAIRMLTRQYFDLERTEKRMKDDARDAISYAVSIDGGIK